MSIFLAFAKNKMQFISSWAISVKWMYKIKLSDIFLLNCPNSVVFFFSACQNLRYGKYFLLMVKGEGTFFFSQSRMLWCLTLRTSLRRHPESKENLWIQIWRSGQLHPWQGKLCRVRCENNMQGQDHRQVRTNVHVGGETNEGGY